MKLAVIGANGRSGQALVAAALADGHEIRAGCRGHYRLKLQPGLEIVKCDATVQADLQQLIIGCDAVVSLIGHVKGSPADVQTKSMHTLIQIMQVSQVKRLVSLTGTGVRLAGDKINLADRFLNMGVSLLDPKRIKDGRAAADLLMASDLDWTLLRVLKLQNTKPKAFKLTAGGPAKLVTSRQEVAAAILEILSSKDYIKKAPVISSK